MFNNLNAEGSKQNDYSEGFGHLWAVAADNNARNQVGDANNNMAVSTTQLTEIAGGSFQTIPFKPLCGIINQM